jgi:molybdopterin-guanine dinucleotide biosynthesis protein A
MKRHRQVAAFILAGGASSRMGGHKALLEFAGVPLIVKMVHLLKPLVHEVALVGPPERYAGLGFHAIRDQSSYYREGQSQGPLVGIASALSMTQSEWNLILACDLPYLSAGWIDWLLSRTARSNAQVVLPKTPRGIEPLAAVYRRECAQSIDASLGRGLRKVSDALGDLRVELVHAHEWREFDPDGRVLRNMNTPADYQEARNWWEVRGPDSEDRIAPGQPVRRRKCRAVSRRGE